MMNIENMKGTSLQMKDWKRRLIAFAVALTLLISSCGLTAFAEDIEIYSDPVTAPIAPVETTPAPVEEGAAETPAPEEDTESGAETEEDAGEAMKTEEDVGEATEINKDSGEATEVEEDAGEAAETEEDAGKATETDEDAGEVTETEDGTEPETETSVESAELTVYEPGTLTAEIDGVGVTLDYTAEACIPEGALLTISPIAGSEYFKDMKSAAKVLREEHDGIWKREIGDAAVLYHIRLTDAEGNVLNPDAGVKLTCTNLPIPAGSTGFVIGANTENIDWEGDLTVDFLPEAVGYVNLIQVQIGTVTLVHNDQDYIVTAAYGPEAGFPAGTALKVREIMPGTPEYNLYSGMTDEALNEDWSEITFERYFDIAFVKNGKELEPQADVDVQITFRSKIEENDEAEVQAVHIENDEATVIESETDSQRAARHDDEAIDTVTFTSDSFSVYGIVQKKKIVTKILDAQGHTYEIEVTYTQEAEIPEDARVRVEEIPEGSDLWEAYRIQTAAALNADDVRLPGLYDISIVDAAGNKVDPKAVVNVAIRLLNDENTTEDIQVVHFKEEIPQELVEAAVQTQETIEQTKAQTESLAEEDRIASEEIQVSVEGDTVSFETKSFSVYAFAYTVDFHYEGIDYSIEGNSQILLSELIPILNIRVGATEGNEGELLNVADVESVTFTDEHLVTVRQVSGLITYNGVENKDVGEKDFLLSSLEPFTSDEVLAIQLTDGSAIFVNVTDSQETTDLNKLVKEVSITTNSGESVIEDGNRIITTKNESYNLKFVFQENELLQYDNDATLVYNVPEGVTIKNTGSSVFDITIGSRVVTGNTYEIVTNGDGSQQIKFKFNTSHKNFRYINTSPDLEITRIFTAEFSDTTSRIEFGSDGTFGFSTRVDDKHNAKVSKTGYYDPSDHKMHYKVLVVSEFGDSENVSVKDTLTGSALSNAVITHVYNTDINGNYLSEFSSFPTNHSESGIDLVLNKVEKDKGVAIEYTADIDFSKIANNGNAIFSETGNTVNITVPGDSDTSDNTSTHEEKGIYYSSVSKVSTATGDVQEEDGKKFRIVSWKVVANKEQLVSLNGSSITDKLLNNNEVEYYGHGITVTKILGNTASTPAEVAWSAVGVTDLVNDGFWSYPVTDNDNASYEITYQTKVDITNWTQGRELVNVARTKYAEDTAKVYIEPDNSSSSEPTKSVTVNKVATNVNDETTTWKIAINIPAGWSGSLVLDDTLPNVGYYFDTVDHITIDGYSDYTITYTQKEAWVDGVLTTLDGQESMKIQFNNISPSDQNRTINVVLVMKNNQEWITASESNTWYNNHTNKVSVNDGSGKEYDKSEDTAYPKHRKITKTGGGAGSSFIWYGEDDSWGNPTVADQTWIYPFVVRLEGVTTENVVLNEYFDTDLFEVFLGGTAYVKYNSYTDNLKIYYNDNPYNDGTFCGSATVEPTSTGAQIKLNNLPKTAGNAFYGFYTVRYYLVVKQGKMDELKALVAEQGTPVSGDNITAKQYTFTNIIDWEGTRDTADFTARVDHLLNKTGSYDAGTGKYHYTITVNPNKLRINGNVNYDLTDNLRGVVIDRSSITVIATNANGQAVSYQLYHSDSEAQSDTEFEGIQVVCPDDGTTLNVYEIPDKTSIVISYDADPSGDAVIDTTAKKAIVEAGNTVQVLDYRYSVTDRHEYDFISKTKEEGENNTRTFTIDLNPDKLKVNSGNPYELTDTYTGNLIIVGDTNADTFTITADPATATVNGSSVNVADYILNNTTKSDTTYSLMIPDEVHVTISYVGTLEFQSAADGSVNAHYTNTATSKDVPVVIDEDIKSKILTKNAGSMATDGENEGFIPFEIVFNPLGQILNEGNTIELTDSYTNLLVDYSSIGFTTIPADRVSQIEYDYSGTVGIYYVPDGTKIILHYRARPDFSQSNTVEWSNTVTAAGYSDDKGGTAVFSSEGSGYGSMGNILWLLKYELGHMERPLNDVTFALYMDVNGTMTPVTRTDGSQVTFTTGNDEEKGNGYVLMSLEAKNGVAVNDQFKDGSNGFKEDTIYYLKETTQVDGYYKNDILYNFVLHEGQESTYTVPSYKSGEIIYLFEKADIVKVTNTKITDGVAVTKKWVNADGTTTWPEGITSVTVKIQKKVGDADPVDMTGSNVPSYYWNSDTDSVVTGEDGSTWSDTITLTGSNASGAWKKLDTADNITYVVTETAINDTAVSGGTATINGKTYEIFASAVNNGSATVTNAEKTSVTATKTWDEAVDSSKYAVKVKLIQMVDGVRNDAFTADDQEKTLSSGDWTATWSDLSTSDSSGHVLSYDVEETEVYLTADPTTNLLNSFNVTKTTEDDGSITILNESTDMTIIVKKVWSDGNDAHTDNSVSIKLIRYKKSNGSGQGGESGQDSQDEEETDGTLNLTHTVTGDGLTVVPSGFTYTATNTSTNVPTTLSVGNNSLPAGTYTITVNDSGVTHPEGYTYGSTSVSGSPVTITANETSTVAVTSTYTKNQSTDTDIIIKIFKYHTGNNPPVTPNHTVNIHTGFIAVRIPLQAKKNANPIYGTSRDSMSAVPLGNDVDGNNYADTSVTISIPSGATELNVYFSDSWGGSLIINADEIVGLSSVSLFNDNRMPAIRYLASTGTPDVGYRSGMPSGYVPDTDFNETVTLNAANNWTDTFSSLDLDDGTDAYYYAIEEQSVPEGYTVSYSNRSPVLASSGSVILIATNTSNIPTTGGLTVSKTVTGNAASSEKEFNFTVTLTNKTDLNGTYGEMTFTNGVATFTLTGGNSKTASGLPAGTTYTVVETEENQDGYTTAKTGDSGTIAAGETATAAFTNDKTIADGSIRLQKLVADSEGDVDTEKDFTFTITILKTEGGNEVTNTEFTGKHGGVTFTSGIATVTLKHNGTVTISNLPYGTKYRIEETAVAEYQTSAAVGGETVISLPVTGTITSADTVSVIFTNTRIPTTSITASKVWSGVETVQQPTAIQFTLKRQVGEDRATLETVDTAVLTKASGWTDVTWNTLPVYVDGTAEEKQAYTYVVVETGVYFGTLPEDDVSTTDVDESKVVADADWIAPDMYTVSGGTVTADAATITNAPATVNVPVEKTWDDFSGSEYSWTATFMLVEREVLVSGEAASDANNDWTAVSGVGQKTISKGQTGDDITFMNLPMYRVHSNGSVYRILYSVEETGYTVTRTGDNTVVARWNQVEDPDYPNIATENQFYQLYFTQRAGEEDSIAGTENWYKVVAENRIQEDMTGKLVVRKDWLDVLPSDLSIYPEVYFTLYQMFEGEENLNQAWVYPGYEKIALNKGNNWKVVIPDLPEKDNSNRKYKYFVIETPVSGTNFTLRDNTTGTYGLNILTDPAYDYGANQWVFTIDGYRCRDSYGEGAWKQADYYKTVTNDGDTYEVLMEGRTEYSQPNLASVYNQGEIVIRNKARKYMQMDIKKKFLWYNPAQNYSLYTTTSTPEMMKGLVLQIQVMRRALYDTADGNTPEGGPGEVYGWKAYGSPIIVGYNENGDQVCQNPNSFDVRYCGPWHWTIDDEGQNQGLLAYGIYQQENGDIIPVRYQYILVEENAYKYSGGQFTAQLDWVAVLPAAWDGNGSQVELYPRVTAQDQDRLVNIPASNLRIEKKWDSESYVWNENSEIKEIYVKVYRYAGQNYNSGSETDYTNMIGTSVGQAINSVSGLVTNTDGYLASDRFYYPTEGSDDRYIVLDYQHQYVTIEHMMLMGAGGSNDEMYRYWVVECGYKDKAGNIVWNTDLFEPEYTAGDATTTVTNQHIAQPVMVLGEKGNNILYIRNKPQEPETGSLIVTKHVQVNGRDTGVAEDQTFTVGIYELNEENNWQPVYHTLAEGAEPVAWVETISLAAGDYEGVATFSPLEIGKTYRVYELDEDGKPIENKETLNEYTVLYPDRPAVNITSDHPEGRTSVVNLITNITVKKTWNWKTRNFWLDGYTVVMSLMIGDEEVTELPLYQGETQEATIELTETKQEHTWYNLPKYDSNGNEIDYQIKEIRILHGSDDVTGTGEFIVHGEGAPDANGMVHINNTKATNLIVTKEWRDYDNRYGKRPGSITFTIEAKQKGTDTYFDSDKLIDLGIVSNGQPESQTIQPDHEGKWPEASWMELPYYDYDGNEIEYDVNENVPYHPENGEEDPLKWYYLYKKEIRSEGLTTYLKFINVLSSAETELKGRKYMDAPLGGLAYLPEGEKYQFILSAAKGTPMPYGSTTYETDDKVWMEVKNTNMVFKMAIFDGDYYASYIDFGKIVYTPFIDLAIGTDHENIDEVTPEGKKIKRYVYTISEVEGNDPYVTYQTNLDYHVTVTLTYDPDSGITTAETTYDGELDHVEYEDIGRFYFVNNRWTDIGVTKKWYRPDDSEFAPVGESVVLALYNKDDLENPISEITLNGTADSEEKDTEGLDHLEDTPWHALWKKLPVYNKDKDKFNEYIVIEKQVPDGYEVIYDGSDEEYVSNNGTIINRQKSAKLIIKKVIDDNGLLTEKEKGKITFLVTGEGLPQAGLTKTLAEMSDNTWKLTEMDGIKPDKIYTVTEYNADFADYTRVTSITATGENVIEEAETTEDGEIIGQVHVIMIPGDEESAEGEITFTNSYKKKPGKVQVTKVFSGTSALPDDFRITVRWSDESAHIGEFTLESLVIDGETIERSGAGTSESPYSWTTEDGLKITLTGDGTDVPYAWTVDGLPVKTEVEFTETGYMLDGYTWSGMVNGIAPDESGMTGTATVAVVEEGQAVPGVAFENRYTSGVELPATGGSGTLLYTLGGLAMVLLAGVLLVSRRKRKV